MSTQHPPDNVNLPFFAESPELGGDDEVQERTTPTLTWGAPSRCGTAREKRSTTSWSGNSSPGTTPTSGRRGSAGTSS
ncbi:phosphoenolpyruvate carboxylase [Methanoculleus chikugoensis]|uniref:phosphoenolpyruvate carboxylase n=1 Tax=Methanoculleus chikugoensis TaxID=118126 RepID=UPI001FB4C7C7|nr:phosphoenolpyruvate carboxylase [Methanoculleus chikugoensis]